MSECKAGLVSVSFRDKTPEEIIKAVREAKLSFIEWGSDVHAPKDNEDRLKEIVTLQGKYGVSCSSYGTYFTLGRDDVSELGGYIAAAKRLGTNILRLWCGNKASAEYTDSRKAALFADCSAAAKIAEQNGVVFSMECHPNTFTDSLVSAKELMNAVESPAFNMYWQPNQYKSFKENIEYAEWASKYCTNVHIFNWEGDERFPLADGIDIWRSYLERLGRGHTFLLEFMPDNRIESLKSETEALFKITEE